MLGSRGATDDKGGIIADRAVLAERAVGHAKPGDEIAAMRAGLTGEIHQEIPALTRSSSVSARRAAPWVVAGRGTGSAATHAGRCSFSQARASPIA